MLGIGGKVWDSSLALLQYLHLQQQQQQQRVRGRRVLELGSGTGIAGLGLSALSPASVSLTDLPEVVPLLRCNVGLNQVLCTRVEARECLATAYTATSFVWGDEVSTLDMFDLIIASDVVYEPVGYAPLATSIRALLLRDCESTSGDSVMCILAHRHRHPEDHKFFELLAAAEDLEVNKIDFTYTHSHSTNSSTSLTDVEIYHIFRGE